VTSLVPVVKNFVIGTRAGKRILERRRRRRGYVPETNTPEYVNAVFAGHHERLKKHHPLRGRLLEIGPGSNLGVAALFVANGMDSAVCIDVERWLESHDPLYAELGVTAVMDRVAYRYPAAIESAPFADATFDVVVSTAAVEHFADPDAAISEIARLLKPGGITSHQIDLRDHRDFDHPLEFLRLSDRQWKRLTSHRPSEPNRWRASDLLAAFASHGLTVVEHVRDMNYSLTNDDIQRFDNRFSSKTRADLETLSLFVVATKPA
jgi:SAM-dependent methyltransferase